MANPKNFKFTKVESFNGLGKRLIETNEYLQLKERIQQLSNVDELTLHIGLVLADYWFTERPPGAVGFFGCTGLVLGSKPTPPLEEIPIMPEKNYANVITFVLSSDKYNRIEKDLKAKLESFERTPRSYDSFKYENFETTSLVTHSTTRFGIYKKEGFDEAYKAMKVLKDYSSEREFYNVPACSGIDCHHGQFGDNIDEDLVECREAPEGETSALEYYEKSVPNKSTQIQIKIIVYQVDLAANMDKLFDVLALIDN